MFRLAVCDDDREELTRVSALLGQYQASRGSILSFDLFRSAMDLLEAMRHTAYDAVLLDILIPICSSPPPPTISFPCWISCSTPSRSRTPC